MDTDQVLDLFQQGDESSSKKNEKEKPSRISQKNILDGLGDLPAEDEYDGLSLQSYINSLG